MRVGEEDEIVRGHKQLIQYRLFCEFGSADDREKFIDIGGHKMPQIVEYRIVSAHTPEALIDGVSALLNGAWQPLGSPCVFGTAIVQAMVRIASKTIPTSEQLATLAQEVDSMDFSVRVCDLLRKEGIKTVAELCEQKVNDLLMVKKFGKIPLDEIRIKLSLLGLRLKNDKYPMRH